MEISIDLETFDMSDVSAKSQNYRYVDGITVMVKLQYAENRFEI
jgi:hypothetical protein